MIADNRLPKTKSEFVRAIQRNSIKELLVIEPVSTLDSSVTKKINEFLRRGEVTIALMRCK